MERRHDERQPAPSLGVAATSPLALWLPHQFGAAAELLQARAITLAAGLPPRHNCRRSPHATQRRCAFHLFTTASFVFALHVAWPGARVATNDG